MNDLDGCGVNNIGHLVLSMFSEMGDRFLMVQRQVLNYWDQIQD